MTSKINDGGPAFPHESYDHDAGMDIVKPDMSLRDYFAAKFLAGAATSDSEPLDIDIAADQYDIDTALFEHWSCVARVAYIAADAMLAAREATS